MIINRIVRVGIDEKAFIQDLLGDWFIFLVLIFDFISCPFALLVLELLLYPCFIYYS